MLVRKSLCMFIHFLQKASLVIFPTRENVNIGAYKLLFQFIHICKNNMNVYFTGWFRSPFDMWHMKHPTDDENMLKSFWLVVETLAVLHSVKLTRKDLLPGTSLQKTGCVFLSFIAHPFLGPQSSDMCSYFEFYLNGNVRLIKIQDQWNVNILFNKMNSSFTMDLWLH